MPEYMHWRLSECSRCDVLYVNPAPSAEVLSNLYHQAAFDSAKEAGFASKTYSSCLPRIVRRLPDLSGALDVGTGNGAFLEELLIAGFTGVSGIEPSSAPIESAASAIRPLIRKDMFRAGLYEPESFRLVTCFQTIEHLHDPLEFCKDFQKILKPNGALFIIGHNRRAISAKVMGFRSPIFDIEHLQLFSRKSYHHLLINAGFRVAWIKPIWNRYPLSYWFRLAPLPGKIKDPMLKMLSQGMIGRIILGLPAGNMMAVAFKD